MVYQFQNQAVDIDKYLEGNLRSRIHIVPMRVPRAIRCAAQHKSNYHKTIILMREGVHKGPGSGSFLNLLLEWGNPYPLGFCNQDLHLSVAGEVPKQFSR